MKKQITLILALGAILVTSSSAFAQAKARARRGAQAGAAAGAVEPLRMINGEMRGRTIAGRFNAGGRASDFTFTLKKADLVDGKLRLTGALALGNSLSQQASARLLATMAKAENPWPSASDQKPKEKPKAQAGEQKQGRESREPETNAQLGQLSQSTQDTARKTPPAPGERNEQTQSLYAQAEAATGCGVLFFSVDVPERFRAAMRAGARPVQMGVVLATIDNRAGEEINRSICRMLRGWDAGANLEELNRLLSSSQ
jgi:hypothetical protein